MLTLLVPGVGMGASPVAEVVAPTAELCSTGQYVTAFQTTGQYITAFQTTGQYVTALQTTGAWPECS